MKPTLLEIALEAVRQMGSRGAKVKQIRPPAVYGGWWGPTCPACDVRTGARHVPGCAFGPAVIQEQQMILLDS